MALIPGTRLGVYEVTSQIGEGGMGQLFRARDTTLNRDVALKVLPDSFANDAERLARLTREAQTLASLNHPNIAHIHGLEQSGGVRALVMELVEGEDLSQRIARGAVPLAEALAIAKQIAEALETAHERGIIHRDLKPANVKLTDCGNSEPPTNASVASCEVTARPRGYSFRKLARHQSWRALLIAQFAGHADLGPGYEGTGSIEQQASAARCDPRVAFGLADGPAGFNT